MTKINAIIGTNNFGLGPVGKVSSIVNFSKNNINWHACGNAFDLNIFEPNIFKDILFTKDKAQIKKFVKKHNIRYAVVVLDVELSRILLDLGIKVIFVDSLPFMWTQADIDEGLLPLDATVYCAQKCINLTESSKQVLNQIENLRWINPISNTSNKKFRPFEDEYVHINVGGLHSPIGNGESYIYTVLIPILNVFLKKDINILITGGTYACKTMNKILNDLGKKSKKIKVLTLEQNKFLSSVYNSSLFLTSPGLTTIYEIASLKKETIILPPQNLSQFYNIEFSKKILEKYKTINWENEKLNYDSLKEILFKGETFVVEQIYKYITELIDTDFASNFEKKFTNILDEEYKCKEETNFKIDSNGAEDVNKIIMELRKNMKDPKIFIACPISKYLLETGIENEFETFIREIYKHCKELSNNVFIALEREEFGKKKMYGADCTVPDFNEMQDAEIIIAFPEDSMGVSVEIGWASVLKKEILVFIDKKYRQSELVKAINSITPGKRIDIDTSKGYKVLIEDIKNEITNYFNNRK